jgi:histone deacetylase complex subunit SAP18
MVNFTGRELMSTISPKSEDSMDVDHQDTRRKLNEKTLDEYGFITGDYISVSLHVPEPKILQRPAGVGGGGAVRDREREEPKRNMDGDWARGEVLPPAPRRGGYGPGGGVPRQMGMGIRGGARRSPSVGRDRERNGEETGRRRSRSPERRRRDRSP